MLVAYIKFLSQITCYYVQSGTEGPGPLCLVLCFSPSCDFHFMVQKCVPFQAGREKEQKECIHSPFKFVVREWMIEQMPLETAVSSAENLESDSGSGVAEVTCGKVTGDKGTKDQGNHMRWVIHMDYEVSISGRFQGIKKERELRTQIFDE